jgi:hypothetical protein
MRKFILVLILCGFTSCGLFESKAEKTQKLVEKELQQIDWTNVDHYPLFDECDETASKLKQKTCFEEKLVLHLSSDLQQFEIVSERQVKDVIFIDIIVQSDGSITVLNIENQEVFQEQQQDFEQLVENSLNSLPRIEPALKRGVPVRAKFRIPIFLNSK